MPIVSCYICNPCLDWASYAYNFAPLEAFKWSHGNNLDEIIQIIKDYMKCKERIIGVITERHKLECVKPKLKIKKRTRTDSEETDEDYQPPKSKRNRRVEECDEDDCCPTESEINLLVHILTGGAAGSTGGSGSGGGGGGKKIIMKDKNSDGKWAEAIRHALQITDYQYTALERLAGALTEIMAINNMVGMSAIKLQFMALLKFLTNVDKTRDNSFLMHMVISGPPGHGKTAIAQLLGKAFKQSGLLKNDTFITARRADLIGAYCGHTAKNTTNMFNKARGGVIFIDEVYSLGNKEQSDVFTKECIDTINQLLSERTDTLCIVAGYDKEIHDSFFAYNKGLERRFPWRFTIDEYGPTELLAIFQKMVSEMSWAIAENAITDKDFAPKEMFANAGGDVANLLTNCIIAHYHLNFLAQEPKMELNRDDIVKGLADFLENKAKSKNKAKDSAPPPGMYS
jgi:hypothetical protein